MARALCAAALVAKAAAELMAALAMGSDVIAVQRGLCDAYRCPDAPSASQASSLQQIE